MPFHDAPTSAAVPQYGVAALESGGQRAFLFFCSIILAWVGSWSSGGTAR